MELQTLRPWNGLLLGMAPREMLHHAIEPKFVEVHRTFTGESSEKPVQGLTVATGKNLQLQ